MASRGKKEFKELKKFGEEFVVSLYVQFQCKYQGVVEIVQIRAFRLNSGLLAQIQTFFQELQHCTILTAYSHTAETVGRWLINF